MATTLAAQEVGSTVTLKVNGADAEFLVVHQGNPDPDVYAPGAAPAATPMRRSTPG